MTREIGAAVRDSISGSSARDGATAGAEGARVTLTEADLDALRPGERILRLALSLETPL